MGSQCAGRQKESGMTGLIVPHAAPNAARYLTNKAPPHWTGPLALGRAAIAPTAARHTPSDIRQYRHTIPYTTAPTIPTSSATMSINGVKPRTSERNVAIAYLTTKTPQSKRPPGLPRMGILPLRWGWKRRRALRVDGFQSLSPWAGFWLVRFGVECVGLAVLGGASTMGCA